MNYWEYFSINLYNYLGWKNWIICISCGYGITKKIGTIIWGLEWGRRIKNRLERIGENDVIINQETMTKRQGTSE